MVTETVPKNILDKLNAGITISGVDLDIRKGFGKIRILFTQSEPFMCMLKLLKLFYFLKKTSVTGY